MSAKMDVTIAMTREEAAHVVELLDFSFALLCLNNNPLVTPTVGRLKTAAMAFRARLDAARVAEETADIPRVAKQTPPSLGDDDRATRELIEWHDERARARMRELEAFGCEIVSRAWVPSQYTARLYVWQIEVRTPSLQGRTLRWFEDDQDFMVSLSFGPHQHGDGWQGPVAARHLR